MATPKEQHDARELTRKALAESEGARDVAAERPRQTAAPVSAEDQADGQPENELELHDHSPGRRDTRGTETPRSRRRER